MSQKQLRQFQQIENLLFLLSTSISSDEKELKIEITRIWSKTYELLKNEKASL